MSASAGQLSVSIIRMLRMLHATRARAPRVHPGLEPSHHAVLVALRDNPARVGDIAERNISDASTVSRQVSHLTALGLVEKVPDPQDGRAQLVALSDEGQAVLGELVARREAWFEELLADWPDEDVASFIHYINRFCDSVAADERHRR
ncbi:MarR family transcriptional regulator [Janibacter cremeus]|uniref:MarR family winged helix-turn-helix transcriptional regulator n=1 Tax=Janibacter cremeus TaxID=1285192 RepID=UPI0023F77636|nr:MarR family transcriptional regulator [Janibacter cremeus]WEV76927.1 MarR family transcriptional regulator [Janibacter cremeus]